MPDLTYKVEGAAPLRSRPHRSWGFQLRVTDTDPKPSLIPAVTLRCQIRIEPARRRYEVAEQERLLDLFGVPSRWGQTLRRLLWTHASLIVPPFTGNTLVELPLPCTFDFNVAATKYFERARRTEKFHSHSLQRHHLPRGRRRGPASFPIPWDKEAEFRLPVRIWREMMDHFYPNTAWLCLRRDVFDRIHEFKMQRGIPTWEQALEFLLSQAVAR